jgi:hypothetical protein
LALAFALAFLAVIPTLSEADGEESASRSRSERPFFSDPAPAIGNSRSTNLRKEEAKN